MFQTAIEKVTAFTRPILSIQRQFGSQKIHPGAASLFFINEEGWALTARHVAEQLPFAENLRTRREAYQAERAQIAGRKGEKQLLRTLGKKYGFDRGKPYEMQNQIVDCVDGDGTQIEVRVHPNLDLALVHFTGKIVCDTFPTFPVDPSNMKPGMFLCRIGYPFPEFNNFAYDQVNDRIHWTENGKANTPRFPLEGMLNRFIAVQNDERIAFELSTPGLRGQSGGPVFDMDGVVWGMQVATAHLDLDYDVDLTVERPTITKHIQESALLHVGICMHVDVIKEFMRANGVKFQEA